MKFQRLFTAVVLFSLLTIMTPDRRADAQLADNTLIKGSGAGVYWYVGGARYVFSSEKVYKSWFVDFNGVVEISDQALGEIPISGNVTYRPGVRMIKIQTDPKTYAVGRGGVLYWISTEDVARGLYGVAWNTMIDDVSDAFFTNYQVGSVIQDVAQIDIAKQKNDTPTPSLNLRRYALIDLPSLSSTSGTEAGFNITGVDVKEYKATPDSRTVSVVFSKPAKNVRGYLYEKTSSRLEINTDPSPQETQGDTHFYLFLGTFKPAGTYRYVIEGYDKATGVRAETAGEFTITYNEFFVSKATVIQPTGGANNDRDISLTFNQTVVDEPSLQLFDGKDVWTNAYTKTIEKINDSSYIFHIKGLPAKDAFRYRITASRYKEAVPDSPQWTTYDGNFSIDANPTTTTVPTSTEPVAGPLQILSVTEGGVEAGYGTARDSSRLTATLSKTPKKLTLVVNRDTPEVFTGTYEWPGGLIKNNQVQFVKDLTSLWQNMTYSYVFSAEDENAIKVTKEGSFKTTTAQSLRPVSGTLTLSMDKSVYKDNEPMQLDATFSTSAFQEWNIKEFAIYEEGKNGVLNCGQKFICHVQAFVNQVPLPIERRFKAVMYDDQSNRWTSDWISAVVNPTAVPDYQITKVRIDKPALGDGKYIESLRDIYISFNRPSKTIKLKIAETKTGIVHTEYTHPEYLQPPGGSTSVAMGASSSLKQNTKYTYTVDSVDAANALYTARAISYFETGSF